MRRYPLYIFDLDGTLYRGAEPIHGAAATIETLRRDGALVRFLTNNSSQTRAAQAQKLCSMGIAASPDEILTSGVGAAQYLASRAHRSAFVVGEPGLIEVLAEQGVHAATTDEESQAVVVGICRNFTYDLLSEAMRRIRGGAEFVATNTDATYPMERGKLIPGSGAIVAAVQTCSETAPTIIGKPNPYLIQLILAETACKPSDTLVIGDRYETDILSGQNAGCDTLLVLTGVSTAAPDGQAYAADITALV